MNVSRIATKGHRVPVTYNNADFRALGEEAAEHSGVLLVYLENKSTDMASADIAAAIENVARIFPSGIAGRMEALNSYGW